MDAQNKPVIHVASKPSAHTYRLYIVKELFLADKTGSMPLALSLLLVAGIGFEPMTFGL